MFIYFAILLVQYAISQDTGGSGNPLLDLTNECRAIGKNLSQCLNAPNCTFYDVTDRLVWNLKDTLQVYVSESSCSGSDCYSWYTGNVTMVLGDQITVTLNDCSSYTSPVPCQVVGSRWSFIFREPTPKELVGMRVNVFRPTKGWVRTNLTNFADGDGWTDMWAYGGSFGNIAGLTPTQVRVNDYQDCLLDPDEVEPLAVKMANDGGQIDEASSCTQLIFEEDCDLELNCVWFNKICYLHNDTNNLLSCYLNHQDEASCEAQTDPPCRWFGGEPDLNHVDAMCVDSVAAYSVSLVFVLLLFLNF